RSAFGCWTLTRVMPGTVGRSRRCPRERTGGAVTFDPLTDFLLGGQIDAARHERADTTATVNSGDLTTHGVIVGMTGSGKTGLGVSLLEEAAIDGIPCIIVDPKGDLTNLLLQFPELKPDDFKPWLNADDARSKKISLDDFAKQT